MNWTKPLIGVALLLLTKSAFGQTVVVQSPVLVPAPNRVVYYAPPVPAPVIAAPAFTTQTVWYSPSPTVVAPMVSVARPVVVGYPQTFVPAPVTVFRPAVPVYPGYIIGRGAVGQPTVYVPGQPVRNTVRFFSP